VSGYGKATPRSWNRSVRVRSTISREDVADIEAEAKAWAAKAVRLGFCNGCGAVVNEEAGRLHDDGCIPSQPERCAKGQRS
jgi:hypothetical protein